MATTRIPPAGDPFTTFEKTATAELRCAGCRRRFPRRELVEVHEGRHDGLHFFDGDKVCRSCARRNGVSY
jgi:hypothetical protein